jgi:AcrR family transcriptional regulator
VAWNTEETKRRLKQAATDEFAEHGPAGTTMQRIAERAGINKERLYNYFGDKDHLFATVLADELARVAESVPTDIIREAGIGEYAGLVFDYHFEHPQLSRLLHWEALTYGERDVPNESVRMAHYRTKVAQIAEAQAEGAVSVEEDPGLVLCLVFALATWWYGLPQVARMVTGAGMDDAAEHARRRAAIVATARRLAGAPVSVTR